MTQLSESQTRSVAAIGDSCVIPGERIERDPGSSVVLRKTLDSRLRGNDDGARALRRVIPGDRAAGDPGSKLRCLVSKMDSRFRGNDDGEGGCACK